MSRTSVALDKEALLNLDTLGKRLNEDSVAHLSKGDVVKLLVKEKMQALGLRYQKMKEVTA